MVGWADVFDTFATQREPVARHLLVDGIDFAKAFKCKDRTVLVMADCSLSLVNKTGAHYIAQELVVSLAHHFSCVRRWRLLDRPLPDGVARKVFGRMMLRELSILGDSPALPWPEPSSTDVLRLFMDPLYVLRSQLSSRDIVLCHDVGPVTHRFLFPRDIVRLYETAYTKIAKRKPGIVFVSDTSRNEFVNLFGHDFRYLKTIPLYVRSASAIGEASPPSGVSGRYLLTVGALERRKNQLNAIRAYRESGLARKGVGYLLCGPRGDGAAMILDEARRTSGVTVLGYVSDSELRWLYRNATAFVLPSLLEGFGMPALEAASYGVLPIVSNNSALEEAVGGLGVSVDPNSVQDIARGMSAVCKMSSADKQRRSEALLAHAASYSVGRFLSAWDALLTTERLFERPNGS
jgi:glycosyltransferase involved in cell wall biosynthesis